MKIFQCHSDGLCGQVIGVGYLEGKGCRCSNCRLAMQLTVYLKKIKIITCLKPLRKSGGKLIKWNLQLQAWNIKMTTNPAATVSSCTSSGK